jgi:hypothetical protein
MYSVRVRHMLLHACPHTKHTCVPILECWGEGGGGVRLSSNEAKAHFTF